MRLFSLDIGAAVLLLPVIYAASPLHKRTADDYYVGTRWPTVPFEVPESWAGEMPITTIYGNYTDSLFFWYYHAEEGCGSKDDLVIWMNGGPGCSSLEGALQENGPVVFPWNISGLPDEPYVKLNPYSWHKLASVVWVEEPVGTGFSEGTIDIRGYSDAAKEFFSFLKNFYDTFPENKGKKLWLTGESDAGQMVPAIAHHIYTHDEEAKSYGIDLKGISINDPVFTGGFFGSEAAAIPFAYAWQETLGLSDEFLQNLSAEAKKYGLDDYLEKNLLYPPPEGGIHIPKAANFTEFDPSGAIENEAYIKNILFNVYNVNQSVYITDPLGFPPNGDESTTNIVNDIPGFKKMIHAPDIAWVECANSVFNGSGPTDPPPDVSILPGIIETSERVMIQHGNNDILLLMNGSALAIQNMTWGGMRGFQTEPSGVLRVDGRDAGKYHAERGLTFVQVWESGHMIPQDQPAVAFKNLQYLLGQISYDELGQDSSGCKANTSSSATASKTVSSRHKSASTPFTSATLSKNSASSVPSGSMPSAGPSAVLSSSALSSVIPVSKPSSSVVPSLIVSKSASASGLSSAASASVPASTLSLSAIPSNRGASSSALLEASSAIAVESASSTLALSKSAFANFSSATSVGPFVPSAPGASGAFGSSTSIGVSESSSSWTSAVGVSIGVSTGLVATETAEVTTWTTYCPSPTTFTAAGSKVTVTAPTTLTFTECPGTLSNATATALATSQEARVTDSVTVYTTYCPSPTTFNIGSSTVTVTAPTTLTLTSSHVESTPAESGTPSVASTPVEASSPSGTTNALAIANLGVPLKANWWSIFSLMVLVF